MKNSNLRCASLIILLVLSFNHINAQSGNWWIRGGNSATTPPNILGTLVGTFQPINIYTNGTWLAEFTVAGGNNLGANYPGSSLGDGLRIQDFNPPAAGNLDLWTDNSIGNGTHIGFGQNGLIQGGNTRFEVIGDYNGLWFNARRITGVAGTVPRILFNMDNIANENVSGGAGTSVTEVSRFSNNGIATQLGFMRVGFNPLSVDAARRLEIFDNAIAPQFRITQNVGLIYTDFQTTASGDLIILPFNLTLPTVTDRPRYVGIQTTTPGNTLEINSQAANASVLNGISFGSSGFSGLRFSDLRYNTSVPADAATGQGYLSVDLNGDVVYIKGSNGYGPCSSPPQLTVPSAIDLNGNEFLFFGNNVNNKVVVGASGCSTPIQAKLVVFQTSGNTTGTIGEYVQSKDHAVSATVYGIKCQIQPNSPSPGDIGYEGGFFQATGSKDCRGVHGLADGLASNGTANYGGYFEAQNGAVNIGIKCIGLPQSPTNFAAWFEGNILFNGTLSGLNNVQLTSDQSFKTNIQPILNATTVLNSLAPKSFYFDTLNTAGMYFTSSKQYGLIAQDVQTVLPELVGSSTKPAVTDSLGNIITPATTFKTLNYNAFIGILIKGFQEENSKVDSLTGIITQMQSQMNSCCNTNARIADENTNQTDVTLANSESVVLNDAIPNPFAEETTIGYNLPSTTKKAQMLFYDSQGKLIKAVELTETGKGQLNVFADDLSNGVYTYALIVDGQIVDTKRMVKSE